MAADPRRPTSARAASAKSTAGVTSLRPWRSAAACSGLRAASISKRSQVRASAQVAATEYSRKQRP